MKRNLFLVFGEDDNDRRAIAVLISSLAPNAKVESRRRPLVLARNAEKSGKRREMSEEIAALWRNERTKDVLVTAVVHRDCDAVEPAHVAEAQALKQLLLQAGISSSIAVTPAWEIETWWMLFPNALATVRGCWRSVNYGARAVGVIENSKERLKRDLRPVGSKAQKACKDYSEIDSLRVSEEIKKQNLISPTARSRSASFDVFCLEIEAVVAEAAA
ncbi:hypothetical protein [Methylobacterium sp. J-070]|uniref:hypothetical protein n=1 Tax=Methylobacterium sp. J-070 TaxID=2836650 RepID=UPI001FB97D3B|nr:hypothetical protein [Methylobacterium sp. J-070]MCJ2051213.1 hypothetical protein [Methylobacterium sp. J-070]